MHFFDALLLLVDDLLVETRLLAQLLHSLNAHIDQILSRILVVIVFCVRDSEKLIAALVEEQRVYLGTVLKQFKILLQVAA